MRIHIAIAGRVQGVGFRYFIKKNADTLNLAGWARNLQDGRVEAFFEGPEPDVTKMLSLCRKGPRAAVVSGIDFLETEEKQQPGWNEFRIVQ